MIEWRSVPTVVQNLDDFKYAQLYAEYQPVQNLEEFRWLTKQVSKLEPKCIVEIGVEKGGTLKFWEQLLPPSGRLVGVDIHVYSEAEDKFTGSDRRVSFLQVDTRKPESVEQVKILLNGEPVDFLHIDGDHGYEAVKGDFSKFSPFVRVGGLVGFHDLGAEAQSVGVFFKELAAQYPGQCVDGSTGQGQGCGIWYKR